MTGRWVRGTVPGKRAAAVGHERGGRGPHRDSATCRQRAGLRPCVAAPGGRGQALICVRSEPPVISTLRGWAFSAIGMVRVSTPAW